MDRWPFKLLYDGDCPMCSREARWLQRWDRHGRLAVEDITAAAFDPAKYGLTREQVAGVLHGVRPDGQVVSRMEAFRQAYAAIGLGWLTRPTGWPILRQVCDFAYLVFARNRGRLGRLLGGRRCESGRCKV